MQIEFNWEEEYVFIWKSGFNTLVVSESFKISSKSPRLRKETYYFYALQYLIRGMERREIR